MNSSANSSLKLLEVLICTELTCEGVFDRLLCSDDYCIWHPIDEPALNRNAYRVTIKKAEKIIKTAPPWSEIIEDYSTLAHIPIEPQLAPLSVWGRNKENIIWVR